MREFFHSVDKLKPVYDKVYQFVMFVCKLLLVADILITCMSVVGRYVSFIPDLQQLNLRQLRLFTA